MDKRDEVSDELLKADLMAVYVKHGIEDAEKLASKAVRLAHGAELSFKVPVIGIADCKYQ